MNEQVEQNPGARWSSYCRDYYDLCKPKVVGLIVFTAIVGMFLAVPGMPTGSPGMEGPNPVPYDVVAFTADGRFTLFANHTP